MMRLIYKPLNEKACLRICRSINVGLLLHQCLVVFAIAKIYYDSSLYMYLQNFKDEVTFDWLYGQFCQLDLAGNPLAFVMM